MMTSISLNFQRCIFRNSLLLQKTLTIRNYSYLPSIANLKLQNYIKNQPTFQSNYVAKFYTTQENRPKKIVPIKIVVNKPFLKKSTEKKTNKSDDEESNPGLFKRFKQMYRDYWYVLVPVHLITSIGWFGGFYYMAKSGVDIIALLQSMGFSEKITNPLKDSSMGYLAISYFLYKIATPLRYTVTLGGTTISINYLKEWGYIKPVPSKEKLKEMLQTRKNSFRETIEETKEELRQRKDQLKERKDNIMGDYVTFRKELKDIKTK